MITELKLAAPGSTVYLIQAEKEVTVEDIAISGLGLNVRYFVVYWKDGDRKGIWVSSNELDLPSDVIKVKVEKVENKEE
jgi:hypothetical protein